MVGRPLRAAPLSVDAIVAAALRLARNGGLDAVRMRDLAAELDVAIGSIYHHVPSQAALQSVVVEHVLAEVPTPCELAGTPRQRIAQAIEKMQEGLQENPGLAAVVIAAAPNSRAARRMHRDVRATLREAGLSQREAEQAYLALEWLWLGSRASPGPHSYDKTTFTRALNALLDGLIGHEKGRER